ncbi:MAG: SCO family protein [Notoacmeibacter sp.]
MTRLNLFRFVLWALVAAAAIFAAFLSLQQRQGSVSLLPEVKLGAPFALVDHNNAQITEAAFANQPFVLFFGFTHCPEVCPTTLYELTDHFEKLGSDADNIRGFFVSVDPERDTPGVLRDYISNFPRITGITGNLVDIEKMKTAWKVYAKKVPLEGGDYTMDHTASIFLVKADGSLMGTIAYGEKPDIALAKLRRLVKG